MSQTAKHRTLPPSTPLMPLPAAMVTCRSLAGQDNIITIAWVGVVCSTPPMLSIAVRPSRFSHELLAANGDFVVNVPSADLVAQTDKAGIISGRDHDKFKELGLTPGPAAEVNAAIIRECPLALECRTRQKLELGSHTLFLAEILAVQAREDVLDTAGHLKIEAINPFAYSPGTTASGEYWSLGRSLGRYGQAAKKG